MLYLKTKNTGMLKNIFSGISALSPELEFTFEKNYIKASAMNRAGISASIIRILRFMFSEYEFDENNKVILNTIDVANILKQAKDDDLVEFKTDESNAILKITITTENKKIKEYEITTLTDISITVPPKEDMELEFEYNFDRDSFINAINSVSIIDANNKSIILSAKNGTFNIVKMSDVKNKKANVCLDFIKAEKEQESKYNSSEIINMLLAGKDATYCKLKFASNMPLILCFETKDYFKLTFMVAPIVAND